MNFIEAERCVGRIVLREFQTSFGLPDILVLDYDQPVATRRRFRLGRSDTPLTRQAAHLMVFLTDNKWSSISELRRATRFDAKTFARAAECLLVRGLAENSAGNLRVAPFDTVFFLQDATVYEAKLKAWKPGIAQAHRHLWFTDHSYLLMPRLDRQRESQIAASCGAAGVGMAVFDTRMHTVQPASGDYLATHWLTWLLNEAVFDITTGHGERVCA